MPVTFKVAAHDSTSFSAPSTKPQDLLLQSWGKRQVNAGKCKEYLQSSFADTASLPSTRPEHNGFVNTIISAYNNHLHLVLRPDDVWIAILGQFNYFVNAHSKTLRHQFVAHEGKKELIVYGTGNRYTADFGSMAKQMADKIDENVVDKTLTKWILPDFSTTQHNDTVVCSVLMMSTLKDYFTYSFHLLCGIPSVTLEGTKEDWEKLVSRLGKLEEFGEEPTAWVALLRPILTRFVKTFDNEPDVDFWSRVCHIHSGGSGPTYLSGWLTAFCVWNAKGVWQGPQLGNSKQSIREDLNQLCLDDVYFPIIDASKVPYGFCEVDVKLNDDGALFDCMMVAGHLGMKVEGKKMDTVRPLPAWFMFIKQTG